jgi:predicted CXXCH cytochrome family protein
MTEQQAKAPAPAAPSRRRATGWALLAGLLALPLALGLAWWARRPVPAALAPAAPVDAPAPDPRLLYSGPLRNVRPDVAYVGDAACVKCHLRRALSYARHPMARTLTPLAALTPRPDFGAGRNHPFEALGLRHSVVLREGRAFHRTERLGPDGGPAATLELEVRYAIGSGTRGHSYLSEQNGFVFQTAVSWYATEKKHFWDLSPGFTRDVVPGRPVGRLCLFCHSNQVRPIDGPENQYEQPVFRGFGIGCERCHGPGELHVRERTDGLAVEGPADYTIVHPGKLTHALREAVCEQCHLEAQSRLPRRGRELFDYRPGLPLEEFLAVFVRGPESGEQYKVASHVEQMYASKCFQASSAASPGGKMGCVTCHDPHVHVRPGTGVERYRKSCLKCHDGNEGRQRCSEPLPRRLRQSPQDNCAACHMPHFKTTDVVHSAATDHRILRRPPPDLGKPQLGPPSLLNFYGDRLPPDDPEAKRDLAVAMVHHASTLFQKGQTLPGPVVDDVLEALGPALRRAPGDWAAWEAKGLVLLMGGRPGEALTALEEALKLAPRSAPGLVAAAEAAKHVDHAQQALTYMRRLVEVHPLTVKHRADLAQYLAAVGEWDEARVQGGEWLRLDPLNVEAHQFRVRWLLQQGREQEAREEFETIRKMRPPNLAQLEAWFARRRR